MIDSRSFFLVHPEARARASRAVADAPAGWKVVVSEPGRSLDQNAALWPLLECFSEQLEWPVNGAMTHLQPEEWKDILSAAFDQEVSRVAMGLSGGMVLLGRRTSRFSKKRFSEFLEFIHATAAERGVCLDYGKARETEREAV